MSGLKYLEHLFFPIARRTSFSTPESVHGETKFTTYDDKSFVRSSENPKFGSSVHETLSDDTWSVYSEIKNIKGKVSREIYLVKYCKNFVSMETLKDICLSIVEPHLNRSVWVVVAL